MRGQTTSRGLQGQCRSSATWQLVRGHLCWSLPSMYRSAGYERLSSWRHTAAHDAPESNHTSMVSVPRTSCSASALCCSGSRSAVCSHISDRVPVLYYI